jgi:DNA-3-methyladenine glycosylase
MESSSISSSKTASARAEAARPGRPLARAFYARHTVEVARDLLGKTLWVGESAIRIVETEAYRADDPASHSCRGETPRSAIMFRQPGVAYVYFIYGMYEMLNFVTEPSGTAGAVLIRAAEPIVGETRMLARRFGPQAATPRQRADLTRGPGKLCRALGIRLSDTGESLRGPRLIVRDDGYRPGAIAVSPRVGITVAKEVPWRFFIADHPFVSRAPQNALARVERG